MTFLSVFSLVTLFSSALADYPCLCSYAADTKLYSQQSTSSNVIGHMRELDCKPEYIDASLTAGWKAVMIDHHVGYIKKVSDVSSTTCQGHILSMDKVTTGLPTTPTTPTSTTTSASPPSTINLRSNSLGQLSTSSLSTSSSSTTTSPPSIVTSTPVSRTSTRKTTTRRVTKTIRTIKTSKNTQPPTTTHKNTIDPLTTQSANEMTTGPPTTPVTTTSTSTSASTLSTTIQRSTVLGQSSTTSSSSSSSSKTTFTPSMVTSTLALMTSTRKITTQRITTTTKITKTTKNTQPPPTTHIYTHVPFVTQPPKTTYKCPDNVLRAAVHNQGFTRVYGTTCYELIPHHYYHWYDAEANCKHKGGHLVHVQNMAEENDVMRFLYDHGFKHAVWIGLTDLNSENYFHWTSGDPVTFTKWMPGHVSNFANHNYEDCVVLVPYIKAGFFGSHGLLDDIPCNDARPWVCQYDAQPVHSLSGHIFGPGFFNHGHTTKSNHIVFTTKTPAIGGLAQVLDIVGKK